MKNFDQKAFIHAPLLLLLAAFGLITFLLFTFNSSFKNGLFSYLFPKPPSHAATAVDVTSQLENLGNPFTAKPTYARNVWDMQNFNGKIYLGHGDFNSNAGPIDVFYYDPSSSTFLKQATSGNSCGSTCVDEEQLGIYHIFNNTLYTPGIDPRGSVPAGNFYRIENGSLTKHNTISPLNLHTYDIYKFGTALFAAGYGTNTSQGLAISTNDGVSWTAPAYGNENTTDGGSSTYKGGANNFFEIGGKLYVAGTFYRQGQDTSGNWWQHFINIARFDGGNLFTIVNWDAAKAMFPGFQGTSVVAGTPSLTITGNLILTRWVNFNNQLVYIGEDSGVPKALFKAATFGTGQVITLPDNALPRDILVSGGTVYVLASTGSGSTYTNYVFSSTDLNTWDEVLHFGSDTFARSFEMLNGDFYFGLGTDSTTSPSPSTGNILRVKQAAYQPPPSPSAPISEPITPSPTPTPGPKQGDINGDNKVDIIDLSVLLSNWLGTDTSSDINKDGKVGIIDLSILLSNWLK
ncbi:hypothetical protein HYW46_04965 [Candidatus Daviesbacteria bacterium]|nr:hypothetical protein [Candidatus Daviesbacteria bacterium]